jgi:NAD(P)-dependent dehydrogenase (short-subunit alcohol dehydrogenase family)
MLGTPNGITAAIADMLVADHHCIMTGDGDQADILLIDGVDAAAPMPFLDLDDAGFTALAIDATLDRIVLLQQALTRAATPASIIVIGSDAHLGRWHGTAQSAASAALVGIVRSVAMEYARRDIGVTLLALPVDATPDDTTLIADAAAQAFALIGRRSINGETILLDGGANLKFRQAKRR